MKEKTNNRKIFKRCILYTGILVALVGAFGLGNLASAYGFGYRAGELVTIGKYSDEVSKFSTLFKVKEQLENLYDGDMDEEAMIDGAIKGMTNALNDPYTVYMTTDEFDKYMESNSGEFKGIGVYMSVQDEKVVVSSVIEGSPAEKVGIQAGDIIAYVDDEEIAGDSDKAVSMIKGTDKTSVKVTVLRNNEPIDFDVTREQIKTSSVSGEMVSDNVGYIRLSTFDENVSKDFLNKLQEFKDKGMKGLIFDLRSNGGGYLKEAVNIASQFIPKGDTITYTIDKKDKKTVLSSKGGIEEDMPIVILTDGYTASASEVVTGALKDYNIAETVGTTTFGKGIVQLPFELKSGDGALKVTVSKYYTPNGDNIHKIGIAPDYEVKLTKEEASMNPYDKNKDPQFLKALEVINQKIK
ncbi:S41 family peptidase [Clostridium sp. HCP1S3_B4]|uniref:S41 family peptidase n=1 Tax=unclassified Clostridium TaxID=2614128 RepID=UPI002A792D68|nr:S41 family peptidase [Clostridiales bacterium]MDY2729659.1 S41 family peptidase [Clostridium sp.]